MQGDLGLNHFNQRYIVMISFIKFFLKILDHSIIFIATFDTVFSWNVSSVQTVETKLNQMESS